MQVILLAAATFIFTQDLAIAELKSNCPSKCDVSKCPSPSCPSGYVPDRCNCCLVCSLGEGAPCGRKEDVLCGDGLECKFPTGKRLSKGVCQCKTIHRVCGTDGKTYGNVCKMRTASRKAQQRRLSVITQRHKGSCAPSSSDPAHLNSPRYKFNFIADVVEKIAPAVVHVELFLNHPLFGRHVPLSSGSGFIMTQSGLIVTNAHVVASSATVTGRQHLRVQLHDGQTYEASIRDIDKKSDIATIKINPKKKLQVLSLGRSADLRPGEFVVAIGSPFALQNTVTTGIVSTTQRDGKELGIRDSDMGYIQTDAIINYGNSGGPLVNLDGEVIGINTLKVTAGISFAIPSDRINKFLDESNDKQQKVKQRVVRTNYTQSQAMRTASDVNVPMKRFIGIKMVTLTENLVHELKWHNPAFPDIGSGILVHEVIADSPAQKGGLESGDIIVKLNGHPLMNTGELQEAIQVDMPLLLEVRRGNDDLLFNIEPQILMQ
ncbi:serine protease HTRA3a precursor [Danio rerio]|uniref:HtrA serine peptidase 3a n=1 Tax=Danio rerio TaxID=7955 RepID=Q6DBR1_DANRE|nr:serine protease HTRA3a precursor [Danio rerio]AAH78402.1 Zgc:91963 [Danio rerio]|eukprot:NP_001003502.1 probable serine protease HTRA3 precursor [Danio rerio]